jgi:predicted house-cleaning noncanonical NTP pyrophosphatase (MazG superfamily)
VASVISRDLKVQLGTKLLKDIDLAIQEKRNELLQDIMPIVEKIVENTIVERFFNPNTGNTELRVVVKVNVGNPNAQPNA